MKPISFVLSTVGLLLALPAYAVVTPTTYNFANAATSATNGSSVAADKTTATTTTSSGAIGTTAWLSGNGQYTDNGTNYGNTITWAGSTSGSSVKVSAWSTTNVVSGKNYFEKAWIGNYGGDLGVTSQPSSLTNAELTNSNQPNESNSQHAIDNVGAYDALVFTFQSAVNLSNVSIGFPSSGSTLDSDATILYWNGTGDPTSAGQTGSLSARTVSDLTSNGWKLATNQQLANGANNLGLSTSITSKYWLVGAYMGTANVAGSAPSNSLSGPDYFKVNGLTVTPLTVPEPSSVALLGVAGVALFASRRRKVRKG